MAFISRIVDRAFGWFSVSGPGAVEIDLEKASPILQFWIDSIGMPADDLTRRLARAEAEVILATCRDWYQRWLARGLREQRETGSYGAAFLDELMRFALLTDVEYFDLHELRKYVSYVRTAEHVPPERVEAELHACSFALMEATGSSEARQLFELERRLDIVHKALRLESTPMDFEVAHLRPDDLLDLVEEIGRLAGTPVTPSLWDACSAVSPLIENATGFVDCSRKRGRHMADRTLEVMAACGVDRALLVAGGFHTQSITRSLEDERRVSWSVLSPDLSKADYARAAGGGRR